MSAATDRSDESRHSGEGSTAAPVGAPLLAPEGAVLYLTQIKEPANYRSRFKYANTNPSSGHWSSSQSGSKDAGTYTVYPDARVFYGDTKAGGKPCRVIATASFFGKPKKGAKIDFGQIWAVPMEGNTPSGVCSFGSTAAGGLGMIVGEEDSGAADHVDRILKTASDGFSHAGTAEQTFDFSTIKTQALVLRPAPNLVCLTRTEGESRVGLIGRRISEEGQVADSKGFEGKWSVWGVEPPHCLAEGDGVGSEANDSLEDVESPGEVESALRRFWGNRGWVAAQ